MIVAELIDILKNYDGRERVKGYYEGQLRDLDRSNIGLAEFKGGRTAVIIDAEGQDRWDKDDSKFSNTDIDD